MEPNSNHLSTRGTSNATKTWEHSNKPTALKNWVHCQYMTLPKYNNCWAYKGVTKIAWRRCNRPNSRWRTYSSNSQSRWRIYITIYKNWVSMINNEMECPLNILIIINSWQKWAISKAKEVLINEDWYHLRTRMRINPWLYLRII